MKSIRCFLLFCLMIVSAACTSTKSDSSAEKIRIIFETDLGNDIDDALAMDMMYKYIESGKIDVLAIMLNKEGSASAEFADIMNTWYGHADIPIGVIRNGADCETDANNYAKAVCDMTDGAGNKLFERSLTDYDSLPDAHILYRKILTEQPDASVVVVSVGFSTNLARLLDTQADDISGMSGYELVAAKVNKLVTMAGCFDDPAMCEYNVVKDIPAAKKVFEHWPGMVVTSPFEVGSGILFPAISIENDFSWTPAHPMVEAYKAFLTMPYDRPCWDLTALLYAVEGDEMFSVSPAGTIKVNDDGSMSFTADESADRYYLCTDNTQDALISKHLNALITSRPYRFSN